MTHDIFGSFVIGTLGKYLARIRPCETMLTTEAIVLPWFLTRDVRQGPRPHN